MVDLTSQWRKAKLSLGCFHVPRTLEQQDERTDDRRQQQHSSGPPSSISDAAVAASSSSLVSATPTPPSSAFLFKSGERLCPICLTTVKAGRGDAIFTTECSHSFHFHCIASNIKHGKEICPVCRAKWKAIPSESAKFDNSNGRPRINSVSLTQLESDSLMNMVRRIPPPRLVTNQYVSSHHPIQEPAIFDDDEALDRDQPSMIVERSLSSVHISGDNSDGRSMEIRTYPEYPKVLRHVSHNDFSVLIHFKAPPKVERRNNNESLSEQSSRAPVDLITVLDKVAACLAQSLHFSSEPWDL